MALTTDQMKAIGAAAYKASAEGRPLFPKPKPTTSQTGKHDELLAAFQRVGGYQKPLATPSTPIPLTPQEAQAEWQANAWWRVKPFAQMTTIEQQEAMRLQMLRLTPPRL